MAAWVSSLIMLRGWRPAASPSSSARLNLVFDPGRSRRALGVRPQEEDVRPASLVPCGPTRICTPGWRARQSVHEMDFGVLGPGRGRLTFASGDVDGVVQVAVRGDRVVEPDELLSGGVVRPV